MHPLVKSLTRDIPFLLYEAHESIDLQVLDVERYPLSPAPFPGFHVRFLRQVVDEFQSAKPNSSPGGDLSAPHRVGNLNFHLDTSDLKALSKPLSP